MNLIEDAKQMLHYKKIANYVKKNRKDDMRTGIYYVAAVSIIGLVLGLVMISISMLYSEMFSSFGEFNEMIGFDWDNTAMVIDAFLSAIVGFVAALVGFAVTYHLATKFGGKATIGEYFYIGGKFLLIITLIGVVLSILALVPVINCISGILSLLFIPYSIYLITLLASTLYGISKFKAFVAIAIGWLVNAIGTYGILAIIGMLTGLTLGLELMGETMGF